MARLEELTPGTRLDGLVSNGAVACSRRSGTAPAPSPSPSPTTPRGRPVRSCSTATTSPASSSSQAGRAWSFDADGALFRLVSEAKRIDLAYLFDPFLAVQTSNLEPLPHQIDAVYGEMLPRQPLRFLLADDPGAGKTIMAGLYIKELIIRGDVERCLIVAPGSLVEQWQDELCEKFGLELRHPHARHDRGVAQRQPVRRAARC